MQDKVNSPQTVLVEAWLELLKLRALLCQTVLVHQTGVVGLTGLVVWQHQVVASPPANICHVGKGHRSQGTQLPQRLF